MGRWAGGLVGRKGWWAGGQVGRWAGGQEGEGACELMGKLLGFRSFAQQYKLLREYHPYHDCCYSCD